MSINIDLLLLFGAFFIYIIEEKRVLTNKEYNNTDFYIYLYSCILNLAFSKISSYDFELLSSAFWFQVEGLPLAFQIQQVY